MASLYSQSKVSDSRISRIGAKIPWRRTWKLTPEFLPGESHGQKSLECYSPQGHKESDMTEVTWHACRPNIA